MLPAVDDPESPMEQDRETVYVLPITSSIEHGAHVLNFVSTFFRVWLGVHLFANISSFAFEQEGRERCDSNRAQSASKEKISRRNTNFLEGEIVQRFGLLRQ